MKSYQGMFADQKWTEVEALHQALEPWVEEVRCALEKRARDGTVLPLDSQAGARRWIEAQSKARGKRGNKQEIAKAFQEMREHAQELTQRLGVRIRPAAFEARVVPYFGAGSRTVHNQAAPPESALEILAVAVDEVASATGFAPARITAYVLAGVPPTFAPISLATQMRSHERGIDRLEVTATFRRPPTNLEMRALGRRVREEWERSRAGRPESERTRQVIELVKKRKAPPSSVAEWEQIRGQLVKEGFKKYADWRGPYTAWKRYCERLDHAL